MSFKQQLQTLAQTPALCGPIMTFVARNGQDFTAGPYLGRRGKPRHCFENALNLAWGTTGYRYVEGIAHKVIPVHHAWCVDAAGNVIDPTWERPEDSLYCGIAFDADDAAKRCMAQGFYGLLDTGHGPNWKMMNEIELGFEQWYVAAFQDEQRRALGA